MLSHARRASFTLAHVALLASALAAPAACSSSSAIDPEDDAGPAAHEDSGDDPKPTTDGGTDSSPPLEGTEATVAATGRDGKPAGDVPVVVSRADGSLASHTKTGADGRVTVRVPTGGSVSTLATYSGLSDGTAYTYRYVQTFGAPPNGAVLEAGPMRGCPPRSPHPRTSR